MDDGIEVSVLCTTYNHQNYIRKALDSFLMQKTNFKFEILINDDCSTDNTANIIKEYQKKYPDIIKPIYQTENQYSKGVKIVKDYLLPKARGRFFAFCEGDDYWLSDTKLQKQYDFLVEHKDYRLCVHNSIIVDVSENLLEEHIISQNCKDLLTDEFIRGDGGFVATNSLFGYLEDYKKVMDLLDDFSIDYLLQICLSTVGKNYCINENMSAYRRGVSGSWTDRMNKDIMKLINVQKKIVKKLHELDKYYDYKWKESFLWAINKYNFNIAYLSNDVYEMRKNVYNDVIKSCSFKERLKIYLCIYFNKLFILIKERKINNE